VAPGSASEAPPSPPSALPPVDPTATADDREPANRGPIIGGFIVAGIGLFLLFGQLVSNVGQWIPLFVGLIFLAAFVARREYGFLVPGCIIAGVGAGIVLAEAAPSDLSGATLLLSMAAGFLAIWVIGALLRLPENHWWPFIPGGILALVGAMQLADTRVGGGLRLWPLVIVALGVLIIGRTLLDQRRRR
jgi:hypothetical protein